jgi:NAD(P)-dependent dehydrogenase (short-subunit alcohol dehydrogenase family)
MQKPIVITGATSGLGRETALYLARQGYHVVGTARDRAKGASLVAEGGGKIEIVPLELTDRESVAECARTIASRYESILALVNNAGVQVRGYFEDITEEELRRLFEINFFGVTNFTRAMMPLVRRSGAGTRIIFVTSVSGLMGTHGMSAYSATKFGLEGVAECMRVELAPLEIHVSAIEPGLINTSIWTSNRLACAAADSPASPYRALFQESEKWGEWALKASPIRPIDVARTIHKAISARRPRNRYLVGNRPKLVFWLRRYLPGELFDRILSNSTAARLKKATAGITR